MNKSILISLIICSLLTISSSTSVNCICQSRNYTVAYNDTLRVRLTVQGDYYGDSSTLKYAMTKAALGDSCSAFASGNVFWSDIVSHYTAEEQCRMGPFTQKTTLLTSGSCQLTDYGTRSCVGRIIITPDSNHLQTQ